MRSFVEPNSKQFGGKLSFSTYVGTLLMKENRGDLNFAVSLTAAVLRLESGRRPAGLNNHDSLNAAAALEFII